MSIDNDEGDGLAALFGGITPSAEPPREPGPRRSAAVESEPAPPAPAAPPAPEAPPAYQAPASQPPAYQPPTYQPPAGPPSPDYAPPAPAAYPPPVTAAPPSYEPPPAWPPTSPAYDLPAPAPAPQAPVSPAYDLPAPAPQPPLSYDLPPPAAAPSAAQPAAWPTPVEPPPSSGSQPPSYEMPSYEMPSYEMPSYEPPPAQATRSYDLPAPGGAGYPGAAPTGPAYPPTAQYPAGLDAVSAPPSGPAYDVPASVPPAAQPAPLDEPPPFRAPEQYPTPPTFDGGYGAPPGYEGYAPPVASPESPLEPLATERPVGEQPLVPSEPAVPATVFPPGPLLPSSIAVETPDDLERSTAIEKIGLVLAVIAGPIGLGLAIVNAARSGRRRGWLIGIVRASLVLGVLSSIAAGIAGYVLWNIRLDQIAHAEVAAASAEFCAAAEADPSMVTPPTLGWPAPEASVGESIATMQAWTDRWTALAPSSPAKLGTGLEMLAEAGQTIVDSVTEARVVDDAANQAQIAAVAGQSGVAAWHATYCVAP